jgi:hypothetical protein
MPRLPKPPVPSEFSQPLQASGTRPSAPDAQHSERIQSALSPVAPPIVPTITPPSTDGVQALDTRRSSSAALQMLTTASARNSKHQTSRPKRSAKEDSSSESPWSESEDSEDNTRPVSPVVSVPAVSTVVETVIRAPPAADTTPPTDRPPTLAAAVDTAESIIMEARACAAAIVASAAEIRDRSIVLQQEMEEFHASRTCIADLKAQVATLEAKAAMASVETDAKLEATSRQLRADRDQALSLLLKVVEHMSSPSEHRLPPTLLKHIKEVVQSAGVIASPKPPTILEKGSVEVSGDVGSPSGSTSAFPFDQNPSLTKLHDHPNCV